ncbi:hypothetical protein [Micromonospora sp. NPDC050276]
MQNEVRGALRAVARRELFVLRDGVQVKTRQSTPVRRRASVGVR